MRRDHTATDENIKAPNINIHKTNSGGDPSHSKVDINNLLSKVRDDERKQNLRPNNDLVANTGSIQEVKVVNESWDPVYVTSAD